MGRTTLKRTAAQQQSNVLSKVIDKLASIRAQKKLLESEEDAVKKLIAELTGNAPGTYEGENFVLKITESVTYDYDTVKVVKALSKEILPQVVKITSNIQHVLSPDKLQQMIARENIVTKYTVKEKE